MAAPRYRLAGAASLVRDEALYLTDAEGALGWDAHDLGAADGCASRVARPGDLPDAGGGDRPATGAVGAFGQGALCVGVAAVRGRARLAGPRGAGTFAPDMGVGG